MITVNVTHSQTGEILSTTDCDGLTPLAHLPRQGEWFEVVQVGRPSQFYEIVRVLWRMNGDAVISIYVRPRNGRYLLEND